MIENYELEDATGDLADQDTAKPNIGNLRSAHIAGQKAEQLKRGEYSR